MTTETRLNAYERAQWQAIERWRVAQPDWGTRTMRTPTRIASFAAQKLVPTGVLRGVLRGVDHSARWTAVRRYVPQAATTDALTRVRPAPHQTTPTLSQS